MLRPGSVCVLLALAAGLGAAPALAQTRHPARVRRVYSAPPLTIHRRSYLDPGVIAPVGSQNSYVWAVTQPGQDMMEQGFGRSKFGNETLPGRYFRSGRPEALVRF